MNCFSRRICFLVTIFCFLQNNSSFSAENTAALLLQQLAENTTFFHKDSLARLALSKAMEANDPQLIIQANHAIAENLSSEGFHEEAVGYYQEVYRQALLLDQMTKAIKAKINESESELESGNFEAAIKTGLEAVELSKENNHVDLIVAAYGNLAECYRIYDQLDLAFENNQKALSYALRAESEEAWSRIYNNIGATLGEMGRNQEAIDTLKKALSLLNDTSIYPKAKFTSNIGYCYRNMGNYEKALEYHRKALFLKKRGKMAKTLGYSLGAIGRAHQGLGNLDSAIYYIQQELEEAKKFNSKYEQSDAYGHLSDAYAAANNFEKAYEYRMLARALDLELYDKEAEFKGVLYQRKYNLAKKEQEIEQLEAEKQLQQSKQRNRFILLLSLLIITALLAVVFRISSARKTQEKKLMELQLKATKEEQARDREALRNYTHDLMQRNKSIRYLSEQLIEKEQELEALRNAKSDELEKLSEIKILTEEDWRKFKLLFERVYPHFFDKINTLPYAFTRGEKRLMALIRLDMNNNEAGDTLGISSESVSKSKFRLKKKLKISDNQSIEDFVFQL